MVPPYTVLFTDEAQSIVSSLSLYKLKQWQETAPQTCQDSHLIMPIRAKSLHWKPPQWVSISSWEQIAERGGAVLVSSAAVALATSTAPSDHRGPSGSLEHLAKCPQTQAPILKATG